MSSGAPHEWNFQKKHLCHTKQRIATYQTKFQRLHTFGKMFHFNSNYVKVNVDWIIHAIYFSLFSMCINIYIYIFMSPWSFWKINVIWTTWFLCISQWAGVLPPPSASHHHGFPKLIGVNHNFADGFQNKARPTFGQGSMWQKNWQVAEN